MLHATTGNVRWFGGVRESEDERMRRRIVELLYTRALPGAKKRS
jgi:hypothetical protein